MEDSIKQKNIYDLRYDTFLTLFNVFLVGLIALWIAIFVQINISMQYKLLISATVICVIILSLLFLINKKKSIEAKISQLN